jgi:hypothetical protein
VASQDDVRQHLHLPSNIDAENVKAAVSNGVLKVTFPKAQESRARKIDLEAGERPGETVDLGTCRAEEGTRNA